MTKNSIIEYQGKTYTSQLELAKHLGIDRELLKNRINRNWPKNRWGELPKSNSINYQGKMYNTKKELAFHLGITEQSLIGRIKGGWPEEKWGKKTRKSKRGAIKYKGKIYSSRKDLAIHLGISIKTLRTRIKENLPEDDWGKVELEIVTYQGKEYTYVALAEHLNINISTLKKRIKSWPEEKWGKEIDPRYIRINNKVYMDYGWEEVSKEIKEIAKNLALSLKIDPVEAYQLLVEYIEK